MSSKRELELLVQLNKHQKQAFENYTPPAIPQTDTTSSANKLVRGVEDVKDLLGYDPTILEPLPTEDPYEVGITPAQRRRRFVDYKRRISSYNIANLNTSSNPKETIKQFYDRMMIILSNLPKQGSLQQTYESRQLQIFKNHLNELMNEEDVERISNNALFLNQVQNIDIINNTWSSFEKQLKSKFKKIDVGGFIEFCKSYIENYNQTKGVSQQVVNVPEPVIINEGDYEDNDAEGRNKLFYAEDAKDENDNDLGIVLHFEFTLKKRTVELKFDFINVRTGNVVAKEANLTKTKISLFFRNTPIIKDYFERRPANQSIRDRLIHLLTFLGGRGEDINDEYTVNDLITDMNVGGLGFKKKNKTLATRRRQDKIMYGQLEAGNTSIPYILRKTKNKSYLFNKLKSIV